MDHQMKSCEECGKIFSPQCNARYARARFCSRECLGRNSGKHSKGKSRAPWTPERKAICLAKFHGKNHSNWRGGVKRREDGYIQVYVGIWKGTSVYELEHRLVASRALGRPLKPGEFVHHINMQKDDNRNSNLLICDHKYHTMLLQRYAAAYAKEHF